ncbi:DUF1289 domain-containing protein [Vibrio sp. SCSIO 43135]|uniref:DUF1289 domain-containing protein n=1 Tax=Vibrio paucivorans TaxID=2829489 RepID=A0A9X3CFA7_9VIBR|nr:MULTISPECIES: DUF1289 domain-containing protein [Vibrio]MCW8334778.1 DUF1289 domain-containing protein [Vibrio paucivorans]USD42765.1 DUF1289 domain-containing protein [Vibrio sp. SCSIO 43135]
MKTPCIAACKNNGGICQGCHRTIDEIVQWQHVTEQERDEVMAELTKQKQTHLCQSCGEPAWCDISAGKSTCWCFNVEQRDTSSLVNSDQCICRKCLNALPIA